MTPDTKQFYVAPPDQHVEVTRYDVDQFVFMVQVIFPGGLYQQSVSGFMDRQLRDKKFERFNQYAACQYYLQSAQLLGLTVIQEIEPVLGGCYYVPDQGEHYYRQWEDRVVHLNPSANLINELPASYIQMLSNHSLVILVPPKRFEEEAQRIIKALGLALQPLDTAFRLN